MKKKPRRRRLREEKAVLVPMIGTVEEDSNGLLRLSLKRPPAVKASYAASSSSSSSSQQQQLHFLTSYTHFLWLTLACWLAYLLLPRGVRKSGCKKPRKRLRRALTKRLAARSVHQGGGGGGDPIQGGNTREDTLSTNQQRESNFLNLSLPLRSQNEDDGAPLLVSEDDGSVVRISGTVAVRQQHLSNGSPPPPPSPPHEHPVRVATDEEIRQEMLHRLQQNRGVRLTAHGVTSAPKRVWIRWAASDGAVQWQTEFSRQMVAPSSSSSNLPPPSTVLLRGALHSVPADQIVSIDAGKKTLALLKQGGPVLPASCCFSLLTAEGSLDLQCNSQLERDAVASCLRVLVQEHREKKMTRQRTENGGRGGLSDDAHGDQTRRRVAHEKRRSGGTAAESKETNGDGYEDLTTTTGTASSSAAAAAAQAEASSDHVPPSSTLALSSSSIWTTYDV